MYRENRSGPRTEPCGTPRVHGEGKLRSSAVVICCCRFRGVGREKKVERFIRPGGVMGPPKGVPHNGGRGLPREFF